MKPILLATLVLLLVTGAACTPNMAKYAAALANDPAFVSIKVTTIYGTGVLVRDGRPLSGDSVTPDGGVTSFPGTVTNIFVTSPTTTPVVTETHSVPIPPRAQRQPHKPPTPSTK